MKFWVYAIDWRSAAIEIIAEATTKEQAKAAHSAHLAAMTGEQIVDAVQFKTFAITPVSADMEAAVEQFKRLNGRAMSTAN